MSRKTIVLLSVFAALLFAAYYIMQKPGEKNKDLSKRKQLAKIDSAAISRIEFENFQGKITLEKHTGEWFVSFPIRYPAAVSKVENALKHISESKIKNILSDNPDKQNAFNLDDSSAIKLKVWQGSRIVMDILIGKPVGAGLDSYVREPGSNEVKLIKGALAGVFSAPLSDWRDKTIFKIAKDAIRSIAYSGEGNNFVLEQHAGNWLLNNKEVNKEALDALLKYLADYKTDLFEDNPPAELPPLWRSLIINETCLYFYEAGKDKWYVKSSKSDQLFIVMKWKIDLVIKNEGYFFEE